MRKIYQKIPHLEFMEFMETYDLPRGYYFEDK